MRMAINMGSLRGFGSSIVGRCILNELDTRTNVGDVYAWVPHEWPRKQYPIRNIQARVARSGAFTKFSIELHSIPAAIRRLGLEVLFSLGDTSVPRSPVPHLLMVQQPFLAYDSKELDFPMKATFRIKLALMRSYFRLGLPNVTLFTVQTRTMKSRLSQMWGIDPGKIFVVPSAVGWKTSPSASPNAGSRPYVCFVASGGRHKNHIILADVMRRLKEQRLPVFCRLTVGPEAVPLLVDRARKLDVLDRFEFLGGITSGDARAVMAGAIASIIPSKLESFGLPYYESMSVGTPVIAADRDFAREACGDAGLYADASDAVGFARHVSDLLLSPSMRKAMSEGVLARYQGIKCTWGDVVDDYCSIIEEMKTSFGR